MTDSRALRKKLLYGWRYHCHCEERSPAFRGMAIPNAWEIASLPFLLIMILDLLIVSFVPFVTTFIPGLFFH